MCVDSQLIELFSAVVKRSDPNITRGQASAILQGGGVRSNTNPGNQSDIGQRMDGDAGTA